MKPSSPALAAAAACLALLTTACGGQDKSEAGTGSAEQPVEITYWSWMPGTKEMTAEFNRTHKNIKVTFSEIPAGLNGGYDKLAKAVKAGNAPDVVNVEYQALPDLVTQGLLRDSTAVRAAVARASAAAVRSAARRWRASARAASRASRASRADAVDAPGSSGTGARGEAVITGEVVVPAGGAVGAAARTAVGGSNSKVYSRTRRPVAHETSRITSTKGSCTPRSLVRRTNWRPSGRRSSTALVLGSTGL